MNQPRHVFFSSSCSSSSLCFHVCGSESVWQECFWPFFFFVSGEFCFDSFWYRRRRSLTSALFCISFDFGSFFEALGEKSVAGKKKQKTEKNKSMWSLYWCQSEINKNTSKDLLAVWISSLQVCRKCPSIHLCTVDVGGDYKYEKWNKKIWMEAAVCLLFGWKEGLSF